MSRTSEIRMIMGQATSQAASLVTRKISLEALTALVLRTPVDTGRARGNWQVAVNKTFINGEVEVLDRGGSATISTGASKIAGQKAFEPVVIQNNLPYIERLNDGYSKQAPAGYVEGALASLGLSTGRG